MKKSISFIKFTTLILALAFVVPVWGQVAIPTTPNSILTEGSVYVVSTNTNITATNAGEAGLRVRQNSRVVINIKKDVTLTIKGANAQEGQPGMPGIYVPESSTLVIIGEGNLVVTGGNASNGGNGESGQNAGGQNETKNFTYTYDKDMNFGGYGGAGGAGGYGAGAAIGGEGGHGGAGGARTSEGEKNYNYSGIMGNAGQKGTASTGMGRVYVLGTVKVTANSGSAGNAGSAGPSNGCYGYTTSKTDGRYYSIGGGGGGGGGGAGSAATYAFGAGGAAGGGGGSGGAGGADYNDTYAVNSKKNTGLGWQLTGNITENMATCGAGVGAGGGGSTNGDTAIGTHDTGVGGTARFYLWVFTYFPVGTARNIYANTGGEGGAAGAKGDVGAQGNLYVLGKAAEKRINNSSANPASNTTYLATEANIPTDIKALYEWALSFDTQGGSPVPATVKNIKGEQLPTLAQSSIPSKADSYFEGFFTEPVGGEKIYNHDGSVVAGSQIFTSDKTLYAHWIDTKFTIVWDYSYVDQDGSLKEVKAEDKSLYAKVQFNGMEAMKIAAGGEFDGTGNYAGHKIATATINAVVGSGVNDETKVYVTEDQLKSLSVTATALSSNDITQTDNKYVTTNVSSHEALMAAIPTGTYLQEWSITVTNGVKPDVVRVKLLSSISENGEYTTISQMANVSVACTNNGGVYSGEYPVWPDNMMKQKLYYKAQIVGFEVGGASYDVTSMPLTDNISTSDNKVTLAQSVSIPVIHFNLNAPTGQTAYYTTGTKEYLYINEYGKRVDVSTYSGELTDSRFEGWGATDDAKTYETSVDVNGEVTLYASWADAVPPVIQFVKAEGEYTVDANDYMHGSLNVTVHIEDANDKTNTQQWYYVANNNTTKKEDVPNWTEITSGDNGDYVVNILDTDFAFGYVYIKTVDQDGNENFAVSPQYQVDIQAPMILHDPMGKREDTYSVVCSDNDYPVIFVEIVDNIGIDAVVINGKTVTTGQNLPIGVGYNWTDPNAPTRTSANSKLYELAKPGLDDREITGYDDNRKPIYGEVPDYKTYIITSRDAAGNTATREMTVWVSHEWNKDANGKYIVEDAIEPHIDENGNYIPGLLPHVNCKHCSRYILAKKNGEWKKVDKDDPTQLDDVQLKPGDILLMNSKDIFAGTKSINEALTLAANKFNNEGNEDDPVGIATIVKLTVHPSGYGAKVDATDLNNATLVNPGRPLTLDLNGQSIDKDGTAYDNVIGNANVTILLSDGNNINWKGEVEGDTIIPYGNKSTVTGSPIKYVRHFSTIQTYKWQSLYLPFSFVYNDEMVSKFGLATYKSSGKIDSSDDNEANSEVVLNVQYVTPANDKTIDAKTPLFIHTPESSEGGTYTLEMLVEGQSLNAATTHTSNHKAGDGFEFIGCHYDSPVSTGAGATPFWVLLNNGTMWWAQAGATQRPYRWVLQPSSPSAARIRFSVVSNDDEASISDIIMTPTTDGAAYTLDGRKLENTDNLRRGIYIIGGKKVLVK